MGLLSWLFGSDKSFEPAPPLEQYPTAADAANARRVGNWYGSPVESYANNSTASIFGPGGTPRSAVGSNMDELLASESAMRVAPNDRLQLGDFFGRAALASNRIPVAALGFDPRQITTDVLTDPPRVNIQGAYSPTTDRMFSIAGRDADSASTPVHESIHRGLEMLRQSGKMPENESLFSGDEEHLVRAIMESMAGDPEQGPTAVEMKKANSYRYMPDKFIEAINAAASQEIARRKPRGPR